MPVTGIVLKVPHTPTVTSSSCKMTLYVAPAAPVPTDPALLLMQEPGSDSISKRGYAKIFKDVIWETALEGCRGNRSSSSTSAASQQQQDSTSSASSKHVCYDAVVTIGSLNAAQLTLTFLRQAEKMQKAKLPVVVQYTVGAAVVTGCVHNAQALLYPQTDKVLQ